MTDDEKTELVLDLSERVGPHLSGQRTEVVAAVLSLLLADLMCCYPHDEWPEVGSWLMAQTLAYAEKLRPMVARRRFHATKH